MWCPMSPPEARLVSAILKPKLTPAEYLAHERAAEFRSEYYRGETFAMAGASKEHNRLKQNLIGELVGRLKDGPCESFSSGQRVKVSSTGLYTYPDIVIVCGQAEYDPEDENTLLNPVVVIEVLSPSTMNYDRGAKFRQYQQLPSVMEIVLVYQDEPVIERFVRQSDGAWSLTVLEGLAGELAFASVPARISVAEIYRRVTFPAKPAGEPGGGKRFG